MNASNPTIGAVDDTIRVRMVGDIVVERVSQIGNDLGDQLRVRTANIRLERRMQQ